MSGSTIEQTVKKAMNPVRHWSDDADNVLTLARRLIDAGLIQTAEEALSYFSEPWSWTPEWTQLQTTGTVEVPEDEEET